MHNGSTSELSSSQAARRLDLSRQRVLQLARDGRLAFRMTPLGRLFPEDEVEALRRERERAKRDAAVA